MEPHHRLLVCGIAETFCGNPIITGAGWLFGQADLGPLLLRSRAQGQLCHLTPDFLTLSGYRDGCPAPELRGRVVILVDDGLATGATTRAAVAALRQRGAAKIVAAVPVGSPETCREFEDEVDEAVCAITPEYFQAVGQFYEDFSQTTDEEVPELVARAAQRS
jgi:hypothetical protein